MSIIPLIGLILGIVNGYTRGYIISGDTVNVSGIDATLNDRMTYDSDGQRDKF